MAGGDDSPYKNHSSSPHKGSQAPQMTEYSNASSAYQCDMQQSSVTRNQN
jgi:hypothetical protein